MIIKSSKPLAPHTPDSEDDLSVWALPSVDKVINDEELEKTNALGLKKVWQYEPPEEDIEVPQPLTAEEIEAIRQAAVDDGFNQGKEDGFAKGYEEGKAQGLKDGEEKGHEEGLAAGLEQGKEQIEQLTAQWQELIDQLHQPLKIVEKNVEEQLLHLVVQLTEAVVQQEAKTNPEIVTSAISLGIKALPSQDAQTQIYLHPDDIKVVIDAFGEQHIQESGWRLLPAPQIEQGGCQIENSTSNIDLRVKARLKDVLEPFLQNSLHQ